jgi:phage baseplate assembly protein W
MSGIGAALPLEISYEDGPYGLLKTIKQVAAQNLKMLIFTNPGERVMDPDFGVGIRTYLFLQNHERVYATLETEIFEQVSKYIPYVSIRKIYLNTPLTNPEIPDNFLGLRIEYIIQPFGSSNVLSLSISA